MGTPHALQKWTTTGLAVIVVALAAALLHLRQQNRRLHDNTQALATALNDSKQEQAAAAAAGETLAREADSLKTRLAQLQRPAKLARLESPEASPAGGKGTAGKGTDFLGNLAKMMEDPEMLEAMRAQQRVMLSMLYGALFKKLRLGPEELDQLKEIQLNKQMAGMTMLGKGDKKAQMTALTEAQKQADQAVKELLGDEQYAVYQDYESTVGERMVIGQLNQQLTEKNMPLDDVQQEELVTLMMEEREKLKLPSTVEQQAAWAGGVPSSEVFEKLLQQQEELNQRIYARSREVLSETQQAELKAFQDNQAQVQKLGVQMMKGFTGGESKE